MSIELAFRRIAVVNRGESAARLFRAVAELNRERDAGLVSLALHTEAEARASWVRQADERHVLPSDRGNPYLSYDVLAETLQRVEADAVWVGWGFVAEHPDFVDLCQSLGLVFIGPSSEVMRKLGDKIGAKLLAEKVGVPVAAWSGGGVESVEEARAHAESIGYPLLMKATAGGGGRGIRKVHKVDELEQAFERARDEAAKSFGDPTVFMEKLVTGARHVEVQVAADGQGGAWALGVRDCSVQRRNQKIIEESASPVLTAEQSAELGRVACELVIAAGYRNVGTVEFLYDPKVKTFAFLEVNTRLQVEHPVTELCTGLDLVKLQLELASGRRLEGEPPAPRGHAIEVRLNAEDPSAGFAPTTGRIEHLRFPAGPGVRVDTGVVEGDRIQPDYDAMVAKVMAWGADRAEARGRLIKALEETVVAIEGGSANASFLLWLLRRPEVIDGSADTAWVDRLVEAGDHLPEAHADVAVFVAAAEAYRSAILYARRAFFASTARGRPRVTLEPMVTVDCRLRGEQYRVDVFRVTPNTYRLVVDGVAVTMKMESVSDLESRALIGDQSHLVRSFTRGQDHLIEVDGVSHTVSRDDAGTVRAPAPSLVVAIAVEPGQAVKAGDALLVLEAMKMETVIAAPFDGTVAEVSARPGLQVDAGTSLVTMQPADDGGADQAEESARIDFSSVGSVLVPATAGQRRLQLLRDLRWTVLGYDTEGDIVKEMAAHLADDFDDVDPHDLDQIEASLSVLSAFSDLSGLAHNRRSVGQSENPTEYFHRYLRSLDTEAEGLPTGFRSRLQRMFAHYDVNDLEPSEELEKAAFRVYHAQQAAQRHEPLVAAVLNGLRLDKNQLSPLLKLRLLASLDRFIDATEVRFPNLGTLARNVSYAVFDNPAVEAASQERLVAARGQLDRLRNSIGSAQDRADDRRSLLESQERLVQLLAEPSGAGSDDPLLPVLVERLYRSSASVDVQAGGCVEVPFPTQSGGQANVVAVIDNLSGASAAVRRSLECIETNADERGCRVVVDCYLRCDQPDVTEDQLGAVLTGALGGVDVDPRIERITFSGALADGAIYHRTFRSGPDGVSYAEDDGARNCHPRVADRLKLWRFENFNLQRLPSRRGIYLYKATGKDNPRDVRLIAAAEVRDLTPRLEDDKVVGLPAAEDVVSGCADALRSALAVHDPKRRFAMNRIVLFANPAFNFPVSTLAVLSDRLSAQTADLGLEGIEVMGDVVEGTERTEGMARFGFEDDAGRLIILEPDNRPIPSLDRYRQNVLMSRQRGSMYPYELINRLTSDGGRFVEYDFGSDGTGDEFGPVTRPAGENRSGFVAGLVTSPSDRYPDGISRVILLGDPTKGLASIAEAECRVAIAAIDLADERGLALEWYALSAGARIAMDSGTENMDWISRVLRRIIEFTQAGGAINVVVAGINVGAQPYWNAEATMLMHTKGILVMTPDSAMVLTGKQSLDYSGGVSAEDNFGIGGYDRIMGPNGQAQYWAVDLDDAMAIVRAHNERTFVAPGERFPRRFTTADRPDRDISGAPHQGEEFATVGEVFSEQTNPGRKKPFDIRSVMRAVADVDVDPMERWVDMRDAETGVVYEANLDGHPVMLLGISSRAIPRIGFIPADGPDTWTAGTLFPMSSKKLARAINAASGNRPLVVLANLSGFDGSPESLSRMQLEMGAEIGRAITNFDGPIVFCVISRYHGGAFVVFSKALNDNMEVLAVDGSYASVLGGAPAAAVVFSREVDARTEADDRIAELDAKIAAASDAEAVALKAQRRELRADVRTEKIGEKAAEFDSVHTIERAKAVGSVDRIIAASRLRPELIAAVERGRGRALAALAGNTTGDDDGESARERLVGRLLRARER